MTTNQRNTRILKAAEMHKHLLNKELEINEDLQNKEAIKRHTENFNKVMGMIK